MSYTRLSEEGVLVQMLRHFDVVRPDRLQLSMEQMGAGYQHLGQNDPSMGYPSFLVPPHCLGSDSVTKNVVLGQDSLLTISRAHSHLAA